MNKRKTGDANTGQKHIKAHGSRSYTRVEKTANADGGKKHAAGYILWRRDRTKAKRTVKRGIDIYIDIYIKIYAARQYHA